MQIKGQISLEFTIIILAFLIAMVITTMGPGLFGMDKSVKTASASLAHAAMSKLKTNIELLAVADEGSSKIVYIKSPPGNWTVDGNNITFIGNDYNVSTICSKRLKLIVNGTEKNSFTVPTMSIIGCKLTRDGDKVVINITQ
ncbi:class III signal peptide-containing protein [Methanotorris igneus]|uniref:Class III signal peptide-containing protein n=1 Tax=Methanotorris igneus (strain DSM 5666 / JCM 11834 / Kol 5) TaxID=880724 RepID=F6BDF3_METIK|nr:class III signal peptide-containing protein [Methanotorris igneus]AEF96514.1 Class III signal peptide-containing protein [Methanotorris igneus Kol 5]